MRSLVLWLLTILLLQVSISFGYKLQEVSIDYLNYQFYYYLLESMGFFFKTIILSAMLDWQAQATNILKRQLYIYSSLNV